jgi:hypothetical protein
VRSRRKLRQHLDLYIEYGGDLIYPTFAAAAQALYRFIAASKLPMPNILDSGNYITCIWLLDEPLAAGPWEKVARRLQRRCRRHGLLCDAIGDLIRTVQPPAAVQLVVEGDHIDPRPYLERALRAAPRAPRRLRRR